MTLVEERVSEPRPMRGRPVVKVVSTVGAVLIAGAVATWLWLGNHPELAQGSATMTPDPPIRVANDGIQDTRYVLDGDSDDGELRISLRNDGPVAFTVLGLQPRPEHEFTLWSGLGLTPVTEAWAFRWDRAAVKPVTVAPGAEVAIALGVRRPRCFPMQAGTGYDNDTVGLQIRQLGITTIQEFPLPLPVAVRATRDLPALPGPDC